MRQCSPEVICGAFRPKRAAVASAISPGRKVGPACCGGLGGWDSGPGEAAAGKRPAQEWSAPEQAAARSGCRLAAPDSLGLVSSGPEPAARQARETLVPTSLRAIALKPHGLCRAQQAQPAAGGRGGAIGTGSSMEFFVRNRGKFKPPQSFVTPSWLCYRARLEQQYPMPEALDLLKTRRSIKPIELNGPGPSASEIETLLTVASRVPDHGKLTPWRFIVFEGDARLAAGETIAAAVPHQAPRRHARPGRARAQAPRPRASGDRGGEPRRAARQNSRMGADHVGRRRGDQPRHGRPRDGLTPQTG